MNTYQCLIVDDEPIARDIIATYCAHLPMLNVVASCSNALEAKQVLAQHAVDILFLDINMPVLSGMAFLKTLRHPPQVIFTTAYKEYAVDAFDLAVCDYLLKPFSLDRFIVAADKAIERIGAIRPTSAALPAEEPGRDYIFIKTDGKIFKVHFKDLIFAEANGNYTRVVTSQQTLLPTMTFSAFDDLLPKDLFVRVHRSYIINKSRITLVKGNRVYLEENEIPVGNNYKEGFLKILGLP